ncbi:Protein phosphatase 2C [Legionella beliardensis]|uniref:Protein phosphatase 2C n=1 Tax=Legionella beliardensis TaxID=91822 RepID=A0A378I445_9GAMM|nr:PP2C family serine/threonine-protein phosphatase [Legionella beliardensis]STX29466.1 Protein phosphatase 2C [Legionella beliardensis]
MQSKTEEIKVISHPKKHTDADPENIVHQDSNHSFGYFEVQNASCRRTQEDALAWEILDKSVESLTPEEIGQRLWTTHCTLDERFLEQGYEDGTTAISTVYDGKGNIITALLADAASFAAVYDDNDNLLGVVRLNSGTHKPTQAKEKQRIEEVGGTVIWGRVNGSLAVSRAIGDKSLKKAGVCSESTVDMTSINDLANQFKVNREAIKKVQVINTCDGFTDGASEETKEAHEQFLQETLIKTLNTNKQLYEADIARALVNEALENGSRDNITVAIQTITADTPAFLLGVYDGHGGDKASIYVAENIGAEFRKQCALTKESYAAQELSTNKNQSAYLRDNPNLVHDETIEQEIKDPTPLIEQTEIVDDSLGTSDIISQEEKPVPSIPLVEKEFTINSSQDATNEEGEEKEITSSIAPFIKLSPRTDDLIKFAEKDDSNALNTATDQSGVIKYEVKQAVPAIENKLIIGLGEDAINKEVTSPFVAPSDKPSPMTDYLDDSNSSDSALANQEECQLIIEQLLKATQDYQKNLSRKNQEIHGIIESLLSTLNASEKNQATIQEYFKLLNTKEPKKSFTNIAIIEQNKDISTKRFIAGLAIFVATLATGILPGLVLIGLVYACTGKSPLNLFKPASESFKTDLEKIKDEHALYSNPMI